MCLIAFAWQAHFDYRLALVANRDEYYARPAEVAGFWRDRPKIFAGRDRQSGGTWFGVSVTGRVAAVTNYRDPATQDANARSRGELVSEFLASDTPIDAYADSVLRRGASYNGFNLLLGDGRSLVYVSNRRDRPQALAPGTYALSNALLDTLWPKTITARDALQQWLHRPQASGELHELLLDKTLAADAELPATGVAAELRG